MQRGDVARSVVLDHQYRARKIVTRISGAPVFQAVDFNMAMLTETADVVVNVPFSQFLNKPALCSNLS
jgi:hypothetical protein